MEWREYWVELGIVVGGCQCGHLFDDDIECSCSPSRVSMYFQKIAGPVIDRIDIEVLVNRVPYRDLMDKGKYESSGRIKERVMAARAIQKKRFGSGLVFNSNMGQKDVQDYCSLSSMDEIFFENAIKRLNLTARSFFKILKVARTIADLDSSENIEKKHILEAISYKNLYRNYRV